MGSSAGGIRSLSPEGRIRVAHHSTHYRRGRESQEGGQGAACVEDDCEMMLKQTWKTCRLWIIALHTVDPQQMFVAASIEKMAFQVP